MAGVYFTCQPGEITTGTAAKTLLQIIAPTNQRLLLEHIWIDFKGIVGTDAPILVDILIQTTAGTMISLTPQKWNANDDETLQVTAQHTATAEPTAGAVKMSREVHPQAGFDWGYPGNPRPLVIPGGTRLGIRVTAGVTTSAVPGVLGHE